MGGGEGTLRAGEHDYAAVARARDLARTELDARGLGQLTDRAEVIISELVTNAILHGKRCDRVSIVGIPAGIRIEVADHRPAPPVLGLPAPEGMTGRGLRLVATLASRWGVEPQPGGKVVWADVTDTPPNAPIADTAGLALWEDALRHAEPDRTRFHLVLGEVPTDLLIAAKAHVDNLIREFTLASAGARSGLTAEIAPHMNSLIDAVAFGFTEARESIKRQALRAARAGATHTRLELDLGAEAADAGEAYLEALDAIDAYCRAARLLTLETPPQHRLFRRWYVEELVAQLRALARDEVPRPAQTFEARLLKEIDRVAVAQRTAEQSARLYNVAGGLAGAATPEAVATAVLEQGVAALGASGGGLLLSADSDRLFVPGTVGYGADIVSRLKDETEDAELPAAVALRTGAAVWIESRAERNERFPELLILEPATISLCAVPLETRGRRLGALRFSFNEPRLFDEDERRFVLTLAAQAAQALDRSQLQQGQIDASRRLQRSLLPPSMPTMPGVEVAAAYEPFGDGMEVGGDFYDVWELSDGEYAFAIGDVAGTGPEAAALTAQVRHSLRALTFRDNDVTAAMIALNDLLLSAAGEGQSGEMFFTAIFGSLRRCGDTVEMTLVSGGHPPPFIRRADGRVEELALGGSLLGTLPTVEVAVAHVTLAVGDVIVLFTDGVLEARGPTRVMFGTEGVERVLLDAAPSADATIEALTAAVLSHVGGELADDLAALVLRVTADA